MALESVLPIAYDVNETNLRPLDDASSYETVHTAETRGDTITNFMKFAAPSVVAGFIDTVGQSVGIFDKGDVEKFMGDVLGEQAGKYYSTNKPGFQATGDLIGMFIPGMLATKAIRGGSWLQEIVGGSKVMDSLFTSGKNLTTLMQDVKARDLLLAQAYSRNFSAGTRATEALIDGVSRQSLVRGVFKQRLSDVLKETTAFELGVAATMNQSETLYPEEWSIGEQAALTALPSIAGVGVEALAIRKAIRNSVQDVARVASEGLNPGQVPYGELHSVPVRADGSGDRSNVIVSHAINNHKLGHIAERVTGDLAVLKKQNLNEERISLQQVIDKQLDF